MQLLCLDRSGKSDTAGKRVYAFFTCDHLFSAVFVEAAKPIAAAAAPAAPAIVVRAFGPSLLKNDAMTWPHSTELCNALSRMRLNSPCFSFYLYFLNHTFSFDLMQKLLYLIHLSS